MRLPRFVLLLVLVASTHRTTMAQQNSPPAPPAKVETPKPEEVFEARTFKNDVGATLGYRLLQPERREPGKKYPLVLFLHGAGERGDDNVRQLIHGGPLMASSDFRARYPAFIVAPQCPAEKKWVEVPWDGKSHEMPKEPGETMRLVLELLDALRAEFPIDEARIYGTGLSMGGYGTWDILQRRPDLFAAGAPICGGGDPAYAPAFKDAPVWAFHGAADPVVIPDRSRAMIAALVAAGGRPVYTEYEGVGHDSWTRTYENRLFWDWLFAQRNKK